MRVFQGRTGFASSMWCRTEKQGKHQDRTEWHQASCIGLQDRNGRWSSECVKYVCRAGWDLRLLWQWWSAGQDRVHFSGLQAVLLGYEFLSPRSCMHHQTCKPAVCARAHSPLLTLWLYSRPSVYGQQVSRFSIQKYLLLHFQKQGGGRPRMSVCGSWSDGENFLRIRRKFLLALTAICALTAWVPRQLFFPLLSALLALVHIAFSRTGLFFFLNQRAASWWCWSHPQQQAQRPAHTLHNIPSLSHPILALIKTLSF